MAATEHIHRGSADRPYPGDASNPTWLGRLAGRRAIRITPAAIGFAGSLLALIGTLALWRDALGHIDPTQMGDWGLVPILPFTFYAAILLLTASYFALIARPTSPAPLLLMHLVLLIFVIHGTPTILYSTVRYPWSYKHVGIVDYIMRHHSVNPNIDVLYTNIYHNWPGFFALGALITDTAGFHNPLRLAAWAPVYFNLLDLGALLLIMRSLTTNRRIVWLAPWVFSLTNWVGQDYFAPQAFTYFLYLLIIGICLRGFRITPLSSNARLDRWLRSERLITAFSRFVLTRQPIFAERDAAEPTRVERWGLTLIVLLLYTIIVSSHQLTPFIAILSVSALVIFQCCRLRWLPMVMIPLNLAWILFVAWSYVGSNLHWILESIGRPTDNFQKNFINLGVASEAQRYIALDTRLFTAAVGILAVCGIIRRIRHRYLDVPAVLLIGAPLLMLAGSAYGGEILFRLYFFSLPCLAFFIAALLYPNKAIAPSRLTTVLAFLFSICLFAGFLLPYYGRESANYESEDEFSASQYVYDHAPAGAVLGNVTEPLLYRNYENYSYLTLTDLPREQVLQILADPANELAARMQQTRPPAAYFTITRNQRATVAATGELPAGALDKTEEAFLHSPDFTVVFQNRDAIVFSLVLGARGSP